jgi:hypothetical protein
LYTALVRACKKEIIAVGGILWEFGNRKAGKACLGDGGLRIQNSRFKIQEVRFRIGDSRFKIQEAGFKIGDLRFKSKVGVPDSRLEIRIQDASLNS